MDVIKHGTVKTKESEKLYKVTCDACGCVFEAKRSEFHVWPLPARPVSETVKIMIIQGVRQKYNVPNVNALVKLE